MIVARKPLYNAQIARPFLIGFYFSSILLKPIRTNRRANARFNLWGDYMARLFAKSFYNSKRWQDTQRIYKQSKFGICERCGRPCGTIVHHKIHLDETNINDPNITLAFDNLELLCIDCHNQEHIKKYKPTREGLQFTATGELIKVQKD